jgi:hypothetical protein
MVYKCINLLKHHKKRSVIIVVLLLTCMTGAWYWNYKMKYEMIVTFNQTDVNAYDFPVGKRKIDASPWIKQGYKKLTDTRISNPKVNPLIKNDSLFEAIKSELEYSKHRLPKLYQKLNQQGALADFLKQEVGTQYLYSRFNESTNAPTDDYFLVTFYGYQIRIQRDSLTNSDAYMLFGYELREIPKTKRT